MVYPQLPYVFGPDISVWQDDNSTAQMVDFDIMRQAGATFVGIKVSQSTWIDQDFVYNWHNARLKGIPRKAYHFLDWDKTGKEQARTFYGALKNDPPELLAVCDYEKRTNAPGRSKMLDTLYDFMEEQKRLFDLLDRRPKDAIYTGISFWKEFGSTDSYWARYLLWLAFYSTMVPTAPKPWSQWTFWQWGTPAWGRQFGAESKDIDMNYFRGNKAEFCKFFDLQCDEEPIVEEPKIQKMCVNVRSLNLRTIPGKEQSTIIGQAFQDTEVVVLDRQILGEDIWIKVQMEGWMAQQFQGYRYMRDA